MTATAVLQKKIAANLGRVVGGLERTSDLLSRGAAATARHGSKLVVPGLIGVGAYNSARWLNDSGVPGAADLAGQGIDAVSGVIPDSEATKDSKARAALADRNAAGAAKAKSDLGTLPGEIKAVTGERDAARSQADATAANALRDKTQADAASAATEFKHKAEVGGLRSNIDTVTSERDTVAAERDAAKSTLGYRVGDTISRGIDAVKEWGGKPGLTGLTRGTEAAAVGGTLAAGALLAYLLRKKKKPQRKTAVAIGRMARRGAIKGQRVLRHPATRMGIAGVGGAAATGGLINEAPAAPVAPAPAPAPAPEPTFMDKAKTMAGNAWDATKDWAKADGLTHGVTGMNRGTEAVAGTLAAGSLLAYLLRKNRAQDDE